MTVDLMTAVYLNKQRRAAEAKTDGDIALLMELSLECLEISFRIYMLSKPSAEVGMLATATTAVPSQNIDQEMMAAAGASNDQLPNIIRLLSDESKADERLLQLSQNSSVN